MAKRYTETIDSKLRSAWQIVSRMYNMQAAEYGGTIAMGHILLNIDSDSGSFASEIAPRLGMEGTSLSRIINSMESGKLIIKKPDKTDKRKVKLILTPKGKTKKELAKKIVRDFNIEAEEKIGREKISQFFGTVDAIIEIAGQKSKSLKKNYEPQH